MLSVVLAVRNEANNLGRCLSSVQDLADELIVVDGESTDATVEIARQFGAKVIAAKHDLNFHHNKQLAMANATGDLVLQLDADEAVDSELKSWLKQVHAQFLSSFTSVEKFALNPDDNFPKAWFINRKNFFLNHWLSKGGQYPDPLIRFYLNGYASLPAQDVHEQMVVNGLIGQAKGNLLHYSNPTLVAYLQKMNHYTSFAAQKMVDDHKSEESSFFSAFFAKPVSIFFNIFIRHRGYVDGFFGFTFAWLSALHPIFTWLKVKELSLRQ